MTLPPFVIDCDTGRDDALAIWIALNLDLPLKAVISSYGNTVLDNVIENNRRVLALAGANKKVSLFTGLAKPETDHTGYKNIVLPRQEVSGNGLCNLELPPAPDDFEPHGFSAFQDFIKNGEKIDYVITGPASNFAALLKQDSTLKDHIRTVTMMGGKLDPLWQQIPGADFNIVCEPDAIQTIFDHGINIRFVAMNATWPIAIALEEIEKLEPTSGIAETAKALMIAHCKHFAPEPIFRFHDPAVIMACLRPESFEDEKLMIVRDEASTDFGRLVPGPDGYPAAIFRPDDEERDFLLQEMLKILGF